MSPVSLFLCNIYQLTYLDMDYHIQVLLPQLECEQRFLCISIHGCEQCLAFSWCVIAIS